MAKESGFVSKQRQENFSYSIQTGTRTRPASSAVGTVGFSPGGMQPGCETDHPHSSSVENKNTCVCPSALDMSSGGGA